MAGGDAYVGGVGVWGGRGSAARLIPGFGAVTCLHSPDQCVRPWMVLPTEGLRASGGAWCVSMVVCGALLVSFMVLTIVERSLLV